MRALRVAPLRKDFWDQQNQSYKKQEPDADLSVVRRKLPRSNAVAGEDQLGWMQVYADEKNRNNCTKGQFVFLFQVQEHAGSHSPNWVDWACNICCRVLSRSCLRKTVC
jgi:hypothetical protein